MICFTLFVLPLCLFVLLGDLRLRGARAAGVAAAAARAQTETLITE